MVEEKRPNYLSPALRTKKRYLVFQVVSEQKVFFNDVSNAMWHSILNFLGESGASQAQVWIMKNLYNEMKQIGFIRCSHTAVEHVRAALALIQRIGDIKVIVKVLGVSGTIKAARRKFFGETDLKSFT